MARRSRGAGEKAGAPGFGGPLIAARTVARGVLIGLALLVLLALVALLVVTNTPWGREQVRQVVLGTLDDAVDGEVEIGRIDGDLLRNIRLRDVSIRDDENRPFIEADAIDVSYSLAGLVRQRIVLTGVALSGAHVVLDEPPGEAWNFERIFRLDEEDESDPGAGWGEWVELRDVRLENSRVTVRTAWEPPDDPDAADREEEIRRALAGERRERVVEVPGGFQSVMDFREVHGHLPRVVVAHPERDEVPVEVERLGLVAEPFTHPPAEVDELSGDFTIGADAISFDGLRVELPGSTLAAEGAVRVGTGELALELEARPVDFGDLRVLDPALPGEVAGALRLDLQVRKGVTRVVGRQIDLRVGEGRLEGRLDVLVGDTVRVGETELTFSGIESATLEELIPALELPLPLRLSGRIAAESVDSDAPGVAAAGTRASPVHVDARLEVEGEAVARSRVFAEGIVVLGDEVRLHGVTLRFEPVQAALVRAVAPDVPLRGGIEGFALLDGPLEGPLNIESTLTHRDPVAGRSRVSLAGGVDMRDELRLQSMRVELDSLQMDLLGEPERLPRGSTLAGSLLLDGPPGGMLRIEADLLLDEPLAGISRIAADGGVAIGGLADDGIRSPDDEPSGPSFRDFGVRLAPLHLAALRAAFPGLPVDGVVEGAVRVDGSLARALGFRVELAHVDGEERSRVEGEGEVATGGDGRVSAGLRLHELSLASAGAFVPEAGLRGSIAGEVEVEGTLGNLGVRAELALPEGGALEAEGTADLQGDEPAYDVSLKLHKVRLAALSARVPDSAAVGGRVDAAGRGSDPADMRARLVVDLESEETGNEMRALRAALDVEDGLVRVDSLGARVGTSELAARGSFGLTPERSGALSYRVRLDSLHVLAPFLDLEPGDAVEPRPAVRAAAVETVRRELLDEAREAQVEYLATGIRPPVTRPEERIDIEGIPTDALTGSADASGTVHGNVETFDVVGALEVRELLALGQYVRRGRADHAVRGVGGSGLEAEVDARAQGLLLAGFAYDGIAAEAEYRERPSDDRASHAGRVSLAVDQDAWTRIYGDVAFEFAPAANEVRIEALTLDMGDAVYGTTTPAVARWNDDRVAIEDFRLESDRGARVEIHGRIPREGSGDAEVRIDRLDLVHVMRLAQERDERARGRLSLHVPVGGTMTAPRFDVEAALEAPVVEGVPLPDARLRVEYADRELAATASLGEGDAEADRPGARPGDPRSGDLRPGDPRPGDPRPGEVRPGEVRPGAAPLLSAEARLPVDLALVDAAESRLLDGPIRIEARLHDMPVDMLAPLTEQVESLEGAVAGHLVVAGTFDAPEPEGTLSLNVPSMFIVPLDMRVSAIRGSFTLRDDVVRVDSLVARSRGPLRVTGEVDVRRPNEPAFDLAIEARGTRVMDTEDVQLDVDADLTVQGPFEHVRVGGVVRTREGVIRIPTTDELADPGPLNLEDPDLFERVNEAILAERGALLETSPLFENLQLELDLHVARDVWLRSTEANVEIFTPDELGPLRVRMTGLRAGDVALEGTIHTDRGEYEFMGRRFNLARGTVDFAGGTELNPIIRLVAEREIQVAGRDPFDIRVVVSGPLAELETEVESSAQPPLSQTDLLSFLVFGRDAGSLVQQQGSSLSGQGAAGGALVGNLAARATQQLAAVAFDALVTDLETEVARTFGLDVLRIQPTDAPAEIFEGRFGDLLRGTEIEAGRYVTPRLFLAGQARPTFVHPGARMEYLMGRGFRWEMSWRPRFLPDVPTLAETTADRASVLGSFLFREWRF